MPRDSLKKAVNMHDKHMRKPKTATPQSQEEMMMLLKRHQGEMRAKKKK